MIVYYCMQKCQVTTTDYMIAVKGAYNNRIIKLGTHLAYLRLRSTLDACDKVIVLLIISNTLTLVRMRKSLNKCVIDV